MEWLYACDAVMSDPSVSESWIWLRLSVVFTSVVL